MVQSKNVRNTLLVGLLCLLLAFIIWYWTESKIQFYLSGSKNKIEKIGQIRNVNYDALVNYSGQLIWQKIDEGDFVYDGNSLQTNKDSSTEIILDDGQQLTIGTNSLVRFIKEDGAISLQLVEGQLEIKNDASVSELVSSESKKMQFFLKTPDGRISTKSTHLKVEKKEKDLKFEILSGQPKLLDSEKPIVSSKVNVEIKPVEVKKVLPPTLPVVQAPLPVVTLAPPAPEPGAVENVVEKPQPPPVEKVVRAPSQVAKALSKKKFLKLPEKIPLSAPKIKRVDVKVVE